MELNASQFSNGKAHTGDLGFNWHSPTSPEGKAYDKTADKKPRKTTVEDVSLDSLHTVQHSVSMAGVQKYSGGSDNMPEVSRVKGKNWMDDGHHRVEAFRQGGGQSMQMKVNHY
jgi:hypothetical protein